MEPTASEPDEEELFSDLERFVGAHGIPLDIETLLPTSTLAAAERRVTAAPRLT